MSVGPEMQDAQGKAIRSQAWSGMGGQDGSETSGVSPNNNPRRERPASFDRRLCDPWDDSQETESQGFG
jgi:hypothetical protein